MFILINGAFGIGKTTTARLLAESLPGSVIYDPERWGFILRRMPAFLLGRTRQPDDYQDLGVWRALVTQGARRAQKRAAIIVVPMTFTDRAYWDALVNTLSKDGVVHRICLVASPETIRHRLDERAKAEGRIVDVWAIRRSAECVKAHKDPAFGLPINAEKPPHEIVGTIRKTIGI